MSADLLAGVLAGLAVAMPVGAIASYLIGLGAREPFGIAVAAALGVATTDGLYALLAGLGIASVERVVGAVSGPLRLVAAALLVGLAVRTMVLAIRRTTASSMPARRSSSPSTPSGHVRGGSGHVRGGSGHTAGAGHAYGARRTYLLMIGLTAVNPSTILTFGAVVVGRQLAGSPAWLAGTVFAFGAFAASAVWQVLLVSGGSILGRLLSGRRSQLALAAVSSGAMLVLAAVTLVG